MDLREIRGQLRTSSSVVFFGGAGTSTESNIPDFRTAGGLYNRSDPHDRKPEQLLHIHTLLNEPETFFTYYRTHLIHPEAQPNKAHRVLANWEKAGLLDTVITQNIDGLHQKAGSSNVLELHGSAHRNYCMECLRPAALDHVIQSTTVPRCTHCQGMVRPDVVLYGEELDMDVMNRAVNAVRSADFLIIGGTSLVVYPAAGLISVFSGRNLLLINKEPTVYDDRARWVIHDSIGEVLSQLAQ
jgi:NAD-dependent deacetylase